MKVGTKIIMIRNYDGQTKGFKGKIVRMPDDLRIRYGVQLNGWDGHNLAGLLANKEGFWVPRDSFKQLSCIQK